MKIIKTVWQQDYRIVTILLAGIQLIGCVKNDDRSFTPVPVEIHTRSSTIHHAATEETVHEISPVNIGWW